MQFKKEMMTDNYIHLLIESTKQTQLLLKEIKMLIAEGNETYLMSSTEAAMYLKVCLTTLHNWHKKKLLIPKKLGRRIYYTKQQVEEALQNIDTLKYKQL
ncbi:MAG: hypothetical protein JWN78_2492 [Bacteroidota bacterium]|nr:hypothetical protein [Bacteroidota bacterium]